MGGYRKIDKRTTFRVYLPMIELTVAATAIDRNAPPTRGNECIMLVYDEEVILDMQKKMLKASWLPGSNVFKPGGSAQSFFQPDELYELGRNIRSVLDMNKPV